MIGITDRRAAYNFDTALAFRVAQMERPNADSSSPVKSKKKQGLTISNGMLLGGFTGVIGEV